MWSCWASNSENPQYWNCRSVYFFKSFSGHRNSIVREKKFCLCPNILRAVRTGYILRGLRLSSDSTESLVEIPLLSYFHQCLESFSPQFMTLFRYYNRPKKLVPCLNMNHEVTYICVPRPYIILIWFQIKPFLIPFEEKAVLSFIVILNAS